MIDLTILNCLTPPLPSEMKSQKYLLNEITYSFIVSYMWGVGGVSQIMTQYDLRGGGGPEEAKIV